MTVTTNELKQTSIRNIKKRNSKANTPLQVQYGCKMKFTDRLRFAGVTVTCRYGSLGNGDNNGKYNTTNL